MAPIRTSTPIPTDTKSDNTNKNTRRDLRRAMIRNRMHMIKSRSESLGEKLCSLAQITNDSIDSTLEDKRCITSVLKAWNIHNKMVKQQMHITEELEIAEKLCTSLNDLLNIIHNQYGLLEDLSTIRGRIITHHLHLDHLSIDDNSSPKLDEEIEKVKKMYFHF